MRKSYTTYVLLDPSDWDRLKLYVQDNGLKQGHFIGDAIREKLEREDETHRPKEAG